MNLKVMKEFINFLGAVEEEKIAIKQEKMSVMRC